MLKSICTILILILSLTLKAQYKVQFTICCLPEHHPANSAIYIAGNFNGWNPQDEKYKFKQDASGHYSLDLSLNPGTYEFKITRGGWDKVECKKGGSAIPNRSWKVETPGTVILDIEEWQDRIPPKPRASTASKNVHIIDTAFLIPQLNRVRRVWIYLPEDYTSSKRSYPVLYMHDGQNLFDDASSFAGEWGIDEFFDTTKLNRAIVVGIDHGGNKRINEYCPYDMQQFGKGEGKEYVDFLVKTLKPYIDKNYRTLKKAESTFIAGSSMGGLISMYAILKYPKTFGGAGVFSPAFWVGPAIYDEIKKNGEKVKGKIYFYAGKKEGETMVPDMLKAFQSMAMVSKSKMESVIRDEGKHNEPTWRAEFPLFYKWLLKERN